jgi:hypothetical protein
MSVPYGSTRSTAPLSYPQARAYWYQWFFATHYGSHVLQRDRRQLCRQLWLRWSPSWHMTGAAFDLAAAAWDRPDWVAVTVHSYRHRWGEAAGDPAYERIETELAKTPMIGVPTIVLHGQEEGATLPEATADQERFFSSAYEAVAMLVEMNGKAPEASASTAPHLGMRLPLRLYRVLAFHRMRGVFSVSGQAGFAQGTSALAARVVLGPT